MKVGLLTFHRSYNYGAFIQCYALLQKLKQDFPAWKFEVIDYNTASSKRNYERKLRRARGGDRKKLLKIYRLFDEAQREHLPLSGKSVVSDSHDLFFEQFGGKYDLVIVGSDAVWNWEAKPFPNAYFLGGDLGAVKMSYAASAHGQPYRNMTGEQKAYLKQALGGFSYIGTREPTAEEMLRRCGLENPVQRNCDPSLLLDLPSLPAELKALEAKLEKSGVDPARPTIGLMAGGHYGKMIKRYFGNRVQLVALYEPNRHADLFLADLNPFEWARVFSFFNVTVTNFFHGTLLSLKNLTPVIAVETKTEYHRHYLSKIENVLTEMKLEMFYSVFDRGPLHPANRALYRLGLKSGREFWYGLCNRIEALIANPVKNRIAVALAEQEKLYGSFESCLRGIAGGKAGRPK